MNFMVSGIYLLRFNTNIVYVGQSRDIDRRFSVHCLKLRTGTHTNYKMAAAYTNYGLPALEVILECPEYELDINEIQAIEIYDSINNGLNIAPGGGDFPILEGEKNAFSKYSDADILLLAEYIYDNLSLPLKVVSNNLNIHYSTVKNVSNGTSHKWLVNIIPDKYKAIISNKGKRAINTSANRNVNYRVQSPTGEIYSVNNITAFARQYSLNAGALGEVLRGNTAQHKGWTNPIK